MIKQIAKNVYSKAVRWSLEEATIGGLARGNIMVNEFPRSGGTWLGLMISEIANVDFPRNQAPNVARRCVLHCHRGRKINTKQSVWLVRDGRDAMVSLYYYSFFKSWKNERHVERMRAKLDFIDYGAVKENMTRFIDFVESGQHPSTPSWSTVAELTLEHRSRGGLWARYEDLKRDTPKELGRICKNLGLGESSAHELERVAEIYGFERLAGKREKGEKERICSFYRRGQPGVWPEYFDEEPLNKFISINGDRLRRLGYLV